MTSCSISTKDLKTTTSIQLFDLRFEDTFEQGRTASTRVHRLVTFSEDKLTCFQGTAKTTVKWTLQMTADNLFQTIYSEGLGGKLGMPIGIRLIRNEQVISELYHANTTTLLQLRNILEKKLNQRGFKEQFRPLRKIGKGNFGSVYMAERIEDGRRVAVKAFCKSASYSQEKGRDSLINEIMMLRRLSHRNICELVSVYESQNSLYMVMQILQGGHLMDKFQKNIKFSLSQTRKIMHGLLRGLAHMHAHRIMHRDLKPQNLIFRSLSLDQIVIADFGLAADADAQQHLFVRCGTPGFVAPEVINIIDMSTKSDPICDVFSVGVIFHMLLLGRSVFAAKTYDQILVENRQCGFRLEGPEYLGLESSAYGLLKDMLEISPVARITAAEALRHAFFEEQVLRPVSKTKSSLVREPSLKKMRSVENMRVGGGNGSIEPLRLAIKHTHSIHEQQLQMMREMAVGQEFTEEGTGKSKLKKRSGLLRS